MTTNPISAPPSDPNALEAWRAGMDKLPRVAALAGALGNQSRARMFEWAMQNRVRSYLTSHNNGNFSAAYRVLFPELPQRPSQRAIQAMIDAHTSEPEKVA